MASEEGHEESHSQQYESVQLDDKVLLTNNDETVIYLVEGADGSHQYVTQDGAEVVFQPDQLRELCGLQSAMQAMETYTIDRDGNLVRFQTPDGTPLECIDSIQFETVSDVKIDDTDCIRLEADTGSSSPCELQIDLPSSEDVDMNCLRDTPIIMTTVDDEVPPEVAKSIPPGHSLLKPSVARQVAMRHSLYPGRIPPHEDLYIVQGLAAGPRGHQSLMRQALAGNPPRTFHFDPHPKPEKKEDKWPEEHHVLIVQHDDVEETEHTRLPEQTAEPDPEPEDPNFKTMMELDPLTGELIKKRIPLNEWEAITEHDEEYTGLQPFSEENMDKETDLSTVDASNIPTELDEEEFDEDLLTPKDVFDKLLEQHKNKLECQVCGEEQPSFSLLKDHLMEHAGYNPCECQICGKTYKSLDQCRKHEVLFHNIQNLARDREKLLCKVCGRSVARKEHLKRHMLIHEKDSPTYVCNICDYSFKRKDLMKQHIKDRHLEKLAATHECYEFLFHVDNSVNLEGHTQGRLSSISRKAERKRARDVQSTLIKREPRVPIDGVQRHYCRTDQSDSSDYDNGKDGSSTDDAEETEEYIRLSTEQSEEDKPEVEPGVVVTSVRKRVSASLIRCDDDFTEHIKLLPSRTSIAGKSLRQTIVEKFQGNPDAVQPADGKVPKIESPPPGPPKRGRGRPRKYDNIASGKRGRGRPRKYQDPDYNPGPTFKKPEEVKIAITSASPIEAPAAPSHLSNGISASNSFAFIPGKSFAAFYKNVKPSIQIVSKPTPHVSNPFLISIPAASSSQQSYCMTTTQGVTSTAIGTIGNKSCVVLEDCIKIEIKKDPGFSIIPSDNQTQQISKLPNGHLPMLSFTTLAQPKK